MLDSVWRRSGRSACPIEVLVSRLDGSLAVVAAGATFALVAAGFSPWWFGRAA